MQILFLFAVTGSNSPYVRLETPLYTNIYEKWKLHSTTLTSIYNVYVAKDTNLTIASQTGQYTNLQLISMLL